MFDNLSEKLGGILDRLTRRGSLTEADVDAAMREVRRALLEADVSLDVVRRFTEKVREQAIGATVVKSVTPGQMVVKIVHDELIATLGSDGQTIDLNAVPPVAIMMVGLQGSGKTTTTAKLARRLTQRDKRKVLMASLDIYRPAAMEQLAVLGRDLEIQTLPIVAGQKPAQIAKRALEAAKLGGYDVLLLDTAGRTTLDEEMMAEAAEIKTVANPHEVLLVADSLTGQDAVNLARSFDERVGLTGIVLTRVDGDGRGGAALSMRAVTGKPKRPTRWKIFIRAGLPVGFSAWATWYRWWRRRRRISTPKKPRALPRRCARVSSTCPTCASNCCRWRIWAASAG